VVVVGSDVKNVVGKDLYWEESNRYSRGRRECGADRGAEVTGYIRDEDMTQILMPIVCANSGHFRSTRQRENLASGVACCLKSAEASDTFRRTMKGRWSLPVHAMVPTVFMHVISRKWIRTYRNCVPEAGAA
jgi:hypothetical protein